MSTHLQPTPQPKTTRRHRPRRVDRSPRPGIRARGAAAVEHAVDASAVQRRPLQPSAFATNRGVVNPTNRNQVATDPTRGLDAQHHRRAERSGDGRRPTRGTTGGATTLRSDGAAAPRMQQELASMDTRLDALLATVNSVDRHAARPGVGDRGAGARESGLGDAPGSARLGLQLVRPAGGRADDLPHAQQRAGGGPSPERARLDHDHRG